MKKIFLLAFLLASFLFSKSQNDLIFTFNSTTSGRNITFGYSKTLNKGNEFGILLRFNINKLAHPDDQNNVFFKRLYATEFIHFFGIEAFYHKRFLNNWECIKPFAFYDVQLTYSTTRSRALLPYSYDTNGDVLYKEYIDIAGPFFWLENSIGIGFKAKLTRSFYLIQKAGVGITLILGEDEELPETYDKFEWEFGYLLSVGVIYRLKD